MNSIFEQYHTNEIIARIKQLRSDSQPRWGKMNVAQMLAHCSTFQEIAMGLLGQLDMLKFLPAHMNAPAGSVLASTHEEKGKISRKLSVGLGWIIDKDMICHNGATSGFSSFMGFNKKSRVGVVVLSNYRNSLLRNSPDRIAYELMAKLNKQR